MPMFSALGMMLLSGAENYLSAQQQSVGGALANSARSTPGGGSSGGQSGPQLPPDRMSQYGQMMQAMGSPSFQQGITEMLAQRKQNAAIDAAQQDLQTPGGGLKQAGVDLSPYYSNSPGRK